jgi:hypothetical protein
MKRDFSKALIIQAVFFAVLALLAGFTSAASFEVNSTPIIFRITPDDVAAYNFTIKNNEAVERIYSIGLSSGDATNWIISPSVMKIEALSSESLVLNVFPKSTTGVGYYEIKVIISYQGEEQDIKVPVYLGFEGYYTDYTPNVGLTVSAPEVQDPRESMKVSILTVNRNMLDIKNLTLRVYSSLFSKELNISLGPRKEKTNEFLFDLDPLQAPGVYKLNVEVYYPLTDKIISDSATEFKIDSYSLITPQYRKSSSWFVKTEVITLENIGNYERTKDVSLRMPWYKRMFVRTDTSAEMVRIEGKSYMQWNPSLKPMEVKEVKVTTNYRPLIIAIILIVLIIVVYYAVRSPVILLKEAVVLERDEHGISEIKVKVFIKNRSRKALENITVSDKVPGIMDYVESTNLGSMKPTRITRTSAKGAVLHWDIDKLDAFEERIITYRLKSKLKIVGEMTLPKARVKFTYGSKGRERFVLSPSPMFIGRED